MAPEAESGIEKTATAAMPATGVAYSRLMAASVLCMTMFGAVQVLPAVCLEALGTDLGLNLEQRGLLMAVRMAALVVSLLAVGSFGERRARRHILCGGLVAIAVAQVMAARAPAYELLLLSGVVSGLGFGVVEAYVNPLIAQLNPWRAARALNMMNGLFSLGLVLGAFTTGELLQAGYSWRLPFLVWVLPPLLCAVLYMTPRYPKPVIPIRNSHALVGFLRLPLFWLLMVAMLLGGGCEAGLTSWAPNFMAKVLSASARAGAWATILYGAFMCLGRFGSGLVVTRLGPLRLMVLSATLCLAATLGLTFVSDLSCAWVLFALGGLFVACFWPTLLSVASEHISEGSTTLFSLLAAAGVSGCVIVPWAIGALGDAVGLRLAVLVLPASMVLLLAILALISSAVRPRKPDNPVGPVTSGSWQS